MERLAVYAEEGIVRMMEYTSPEGYTGQLYGEKSYRIIDQYGKEVFHTGFTNIKTFEELKKNVDGFPAFRDRLLNYWKTHRPKDEED